MKTPYDAAVRVRRREVDAMGAAINVELTALNQIESRQSQLRDKLKQELAVAANDVGGSAFAYMARLRAEQGRLAGEQSWHDEQLSRLREMAASAFGTFRTIEMAAEGYRDHAQRRLAHAEQAALDDSIGAAYFEARKSQRSGGAS